MIAKRISASGEYEVELADEYVKRVEPRAKYMKKFDSATLLFYPKDDENMKTPFLYEIDGQIYKTVWTNKYEDLRNKKLNHRQLNLFDCL